MKQFITRRSFIKAAGAATALTAVSVGAPAAFAEETNCFFGDKADVTILYTNDVHTYIDNKSPKLTYAAIAAMKQGYVDEGKPVLLVDAGDHIQGTAYGSMDDGATIIELMNEAGYDLATPGNHEFDYGMARAKAVIQEADFPYVSCNWVDLRTGFNVLPSVKFFFVGGRKIAFVGVTTPETFTKSTPAYFMNDAQTKYIYDILGGEDGQKLYDAVQKAIDKAEFWGADTIIGLGHLGVDPSSSPWTSEEVIAHTHGFTAFIDGHSHTVMANKQVTDASGKVLMQSTAEAEKVAGVEALDPRNAYIMHQMLHGVATSGTAARATASLKRTDIAGKTGTSNDAFDVWFVGYAGDQWAAVWMGFDQPRSLGRRAQGAGLALPVWIDYMRDAIKNEPNVVRKAPPGVTEEGGNLYYTNRKDAIPNLGLDQPATDDPIGALIHDSSVRGQIF